MEVTIGRIVHYTLSEKDALEVNRRRTNGQSISERIPIKEWPLGAQAHIGISVKAGDVFPMIVTRVFNTGLVNGQVLLDGNDVLWATSVRESTHDPERKEGHEWNWPIVK